MLVSAIKFAGFEMTFKAQQVFVLWFGLSACWFYSVLCHSVAIDLVDR